MAAPCRTPDTPPTTRVPPAYDPAREGRARRLVAEGCTCEGNLDWEAAIAAYQEAVDLEPQDPTVRYYAHNNLGYSLLQLGRFDEAEEHCEAAIHVNRGLHNALKNLGLAYQGQGRWLDAALSLAEAARLRPQDTRAWQHLQKLLAARPALLRQSVALVAAVVGVQAHYEAEGIAPRLN